MQKCKESRGQVRKDQVPWPRLGGQSVSQVEGHSQREEAGGDISKEEGKGRGERKKIGGMRMQVAEREEIKRRLKKRKTEGGKKGTETENRMTKKNQENSRELYR